jgi:hypothetical protein
VENNKKNVGKSVQGMSTPKQYKYRILCPRNFGQENVIFDTYEVGRSYLGHLGHLGYLGFLPHFFTFRLLDLRFLCV